MSSATASGRCRTPAENLLRLQKARIELGLAGARSVEFRGGRLSVTGVELDSPRARGAGRSRSRERSTNGASRPQRVRVDGDPEARLTAVLALAGGPARGAARPGEARGGLIP